MTTKHGGILGLFAHPDDEEFGTSGALIIAAQRGLRVQVVSATCGDAGEISDPALATPETLGAVREAELRAACAALGIAEPRLLRHGDGKLAETDSGRLRDDLVVIIREERPRVVITFDANGGYGHPDHIAVHHAAVAAFSAAADARHRPDLGPPHAADKLYATAYPQSRILQMNDDFVANGYPRIDFGSVQTIDADEIGTADERITTRVPVDHLWDQRWRAFRCHRTQYGDRHPFVALPDGVMRGWMQFDCFRRISPAPAPGAVLPDETDLWHGLTETGPQPTS
ncbi:MAG: PIG-L deacetylase family protein [Thermomicrobiales bacterium]